MLGDIHNPRWLYVQSRIAPLRRPARLGDPARAMPIATPRGGAGGGGCGDSAGVLLRLLRRGALRRSGIQIHRAAVVREVCVVPSTWEAARLIDCHISRSVSGVLRRCYGRSKITRSLEQGQ